MPQFNYRPLRALLLALAATIAAAPLRAERRIEGAVLYDGVPAASESLRAALLQYRVSSESRLLGWLANGELLVGTRFDGGEQLERLRAPGAPQATLSHAGGALHDAATQPFHSQLLSYLADDGQHNAAALYVQDVAGGSERALLPASAQPGAALFAHDGSRLAFSATLEDSANAGVFIAAASGASAPRRLLRGAGDSWQVLGWTRSDRALLVERSPRVAGAASSADDELWLIDIDGGTQRRVEAGGHISQAVLANDDRGVYVLSDRDSEYARLRYVDFFGAAPRELNSGLAHDIEQFDLSADGRYLAFSWNDNGYSRVSIIERPLQERPLAREVHASELPVGVVHALRFALSGPRLAIDLTGSAAVRDVYVFDPADGSTVRWTRSALGAANPGSLIMPQTLRFPTWDRPYGRPRQLSAQLYRPADAQRHAAVIMLAGRAHQARAQLDMFVQFLVTQLHLAVIVPDLRGASGHGRSFAALGRGDERSGESLDLGALLAWIGSQTDLQRERVALLGTGDGGELALAGLGIYNDRLRAAISVDGVAGVAQLAAVRQPVLLLRGLGDAPISAAAAEQLLWRLRGNAVESWFVAPREAQGRLATNDARLAAHQTMAQFLLKYLGPETAPAAASAR
jgi:dipeptidyl aminopeptidase/acylaminoacyl peptidase